MLDGGPRSHGNSERPAAMSVEKGRWYYSFLFLLDDDGMASRARTGGRCGLRPERVVHLAIHPPFEARTSFEYTFLTCSNNLYVYSFHFPTSAYDIETVFPLEKNFFEGFVTAFTSGFFAAAGETMHAYLGWLPDPSTYLSPCTVVLDTSAAAAVISS